MVAPVIVGTARVATAAGKGARSARRGRQKSGKRRTNQDDYTRHLPANRKTAPTASRLLDVRAQRLKEKQDGIDKENQSQMVSLRKRWLLKRAQSQKNSAKKAKPSAASSAFKAVQTTKAAAVMVEESIFYLPAWGVQVLAALSYHFATFIADETWFGFLLPLDTVKFLSWAVCIIIGGIFMIKALMSFTLSGTNMNKDAIILTFPLCFFLYWAPYAFFGPWVIVWSAVIVWSQRK